MITAPLKYLIAILIHVLLRFSYNFVMISTSVSPSLKLAAGYAAIHINNLGAIEIYFDYWRINYLFQIETLFTMLVTDVLICRHHCHSRCWGFPRITHHLCSFLDELVHTAETNAGCSPSKITEVVTLQLLQQVISESTALENKQKGTQI